MWKILKSDKVRNIFYDFFIGSKKPSRQLSAIKEFKVEPTRHPYQMSLPNWTPFKCISFLASKAISASPHAGGANFVFYQTLQGFRFVSVETLMQGGFNRYLELNKTDAIKKNPSLQNNIDRNDVSQIDIDLRILVFCAIIWLGRYDPAVPSFY